MGLWGRRWWPVFCRFSRVPQALRKQMRRYDHTTLGCLLHAQIEWMIMMEIRNQHAITTAAAIDDNSDPDDRCEHVWLLYCMRNHFIPFAVGDALVTGIEAYTTTAVQKLIKLVTSSKGSKGCLSSLKTHHCKGSNNLYHWDVTTSCESCKANDGPFFHSPQTLTIEANLPGESRGLTHRHSLDGGMAQGNGGPNDPWVEVCPEFLWQILPLRATFFRFFKV